MARDASNHNMGTLGASGQISNNGKVYDYFDD
jgi:hypothetical protein